jgi:signal transduction protein with GAF and PtsI domain
MDMEGAKRPKMAKKLDTVFKPFLNSVHLLVKAERCTLYLFNEDKGELWTCAASGSGDATRIIKLPIDSNALAVTPTRTRELLNVFNARSDARHDGSWDAKTGFVTGSVLSVPILPIA